MVVGPWQLLPVATPDPPREGVCAYSLVAASRAAPRDMSSLRQNCLTMGCEGPFNVHTNVSKAISRFITGCCMARIDPRFGHEATPDPA